jgi:predicted metal-dependent hydrolase
MSVRNGIKKAIKHGYVECDTKGNYKSYRLRVRYLDSGVQNLDHSEENADKSENGVQNLDPKVQDLEDKPHNLDPKGKNGRPSNIERNQKETFKETKRENGDQISINKFSVPETPEPEKGVPPFLPRLVDKYCVKLGIIEEQSIQYHTDLVAGWYQSNPVSQEDFRFYIESVMKSTVASFPVSVKDRDARNFFFKNMRQSLKTAQSVPVVIESN